MDGQLGSMIRKHMQCVWNNMHAIQLTDTLDNVSLHKEVKCIFIFAHFLFKTTKFRYSLFTKPRLKSAHMTADDATTSIDIWRRKAQVFVFYTKRKIYAGPWIHFLFKRLKSHVLWSPWFFCDKQWLYDAWFLLFCTSPCRLRHHLYSIVLCVVGEECSSLQYCKV